MPKPPPTYYCQTCDGELWPTRDGRYWACPKGCSKLLGEKHCNQHCGMNKAQQVKFEQQLKRWRAENDEKKRQYEEMLAKANEALPDIPIAGIELKVDKRPSFDVWWVMGMEGKFQLVKRGIKAGCILAYDPMYHPRAKENAVRVVSLRRLSERQLLYRAELLVGKTK